VTSAQDGSAPLRRFAAGLAVAALIGLGVFGALVWRAVSVENLPPRDAERRLDTIRTVFRNAPPLVRRDEAGRFVRTEASGRSGAPPARLHVVLYRASENRLISADVPLWFLKIKGPAAAVTLRDTGFDLDVLGVTVDDLERSGSGLILDERRGEDTLLAWTQ
jgi:hypothetical protein